MNKKNLTDIPGHQASQSKVASSGGRIFQAKETESAKSLKQGHGWMFKENQGRRAV